MIPSPVRRKVGFRAGICAAIWAATAAGAAAQDPLPYILDASGIPARNGSGLCWRTGFWTPAHAAAARSGELPLGCLCEPDLMPAPTCATPSASPAPVQKSPPTPAVETRASETPRPPAAADKIKLSAEASFRFNQSVLDERSRAGLDQLVATLAGVQLEVILAVGHSDRIGPAAYNQQLSDKRAAAVKDYLIGKGIPASRIYTEGKGETQPSHLGACEGLGPDLSTNHRLVECLAVNRRVEIEAIGIR